MHSPSSMNQAMVSGLPNALQKSSNGPQLLVKPSHLSEVCEQGCHAALATEKLCADSPTAHTLKMVSATRTHKLSGKKHQHSSQMATGVQPKPEATGAYTEITLHHDIGQGTDSRDRLLSLYKWSVKGTRSPLRRSGPDAPQHSDIRWPSPNFPFTTLF